MVLQRGLLARLRHMLCIGRNLFAAVLLLVLHFFVVRDIAWIGHGRMVTRLSSSKRQTVAGSRPAGSFMSFDAAKRNCLF